jgi:nucleoside-diphosphate-sugar epimerase
MKTILVTGACGEIGHGLIGKLHTNKAFVVATDIREPDEVLSQKVGKFYKGDISKKSTLEHIFENHDFDAVYHLASMLSTSGERDPVRAHHINTDGAIYALKFAERQARRKKRRIKFLFPSSIAVYGLPNLVEKGKEEKVSEDRYLTPTTSYGCNKIYIELLGNYYSKYFEKYSEGSGYLDFRSVRFPGIISADTIPSGGTSDFGPEMLHAAARGEPYECFVREDSKIPFMVMPDAIEALLQLNKVGRKRLSRFVYNVGSFSISAGEIYKIAKTKYPKFKITYKPHTKRQAIVDSWPLDVDDSTAKRDWGWRPKFNKRDSFEKYLLPAIERRY